MAFGTDFRKRVPRRVSFVIARHPAEFSKRPQNLHFIDEILVADGQPVFGPAGAVRNQCRVGEH